MYEYDDRYPALRGVVGEQYRGLPDEDLEAVLAEAGYSAEDVEFSLQDFGRGLATVGSAVLPVAGTVVGTAFGGPLGGALGGALGSAAGGALGSVAAPPRRSSRRAPGPRRPPAPRYAAAPPRPAAVPQLPLPAAAPAPAAAQLLDLIRRPEVLQALQALALGGVGASSVPVGPTAVPPAAFANLIGVAAAEAAAEHHALLGGGDAATPEYLLGEGGEALVDITDANERAARLLEVLAENDQAWEWDESADEAWEWGEAWQEEPDAFDAMYDAMETDEVLYG